MAQSTDSPQRTTAKGPRLGLGADGTASPAGLAVKILALGVMTAIAVWGALPLISAQNWIGLGILVAVTALAYYVYLSPRLVPIKYLLPGTIFLIAFQILPVVYTVSIAFRTSAMVTAGARKRRSWPSRGPRSSRFPTRPPTP